MKTRLRSYLVLVVTLALLFLVLRKVGLSELGTQLRQANPRFVLLSFAVSPLLIMTSVIKWQLLLKSQHIIVPLRRLYALYIIGYFFNNFLPSNVGGDVVRGYELGKSTKNQAEALASVFMDRLTGFIMLVLLALISFVSHITLIQNQVLQLTMVVALAGMVSVVWLILDARPLNFIAGHIKVPVAQKYIAKLQKFHASLYAYRQRKGTLVLACCWSLVFMLGAIVNVYVSAMAFHQPIGFMDIVIVVPIILLVAMMPLTFNGYGIQEWAYVLLFTWIGLPASVGLSTIVLIRAKNILSAVMGGLVYSRLKLQQEGALVSGSAD